MADLDPKKQHEFAVSVVETLRARGFCAYWAGGCVRDELLGRTPKDYDVATSATPEQIRQLFGRERTLAIGAAFGVITVLGKKKAGQIEVTTFREDAGYSDGRHPDSVEFSTPAHDAQRRDFTINGMFYDPLAGEVVDFVGGQEDLARRLVRAIGDPRQRFSEDKLRMLRAVRFTASFGFTLDPATASAIQQMGGEISVVSPERIAVEMRCMLTGIERARAIDLLSDVGLLGVLLPELPAPGPGQTLAERHPDWPLTLSALQSLEQPSFSVALAVLLHSFADPARGEEICRRWKLSNRETRLTRWILETAQSLAQARQMPWPKLQRLLIAPEIDELVQFSEAIARSRREGLEDLQYCRQLLLKPQHELNPLPLITGDDLLEHGVPRGPVYQWLLEQVRDAQLDGRLHTKSEALRMVDMLRAARQQS